MRTAGASILLAVAAGSAVSVATAQTNVVVPNSFATTGGGGGLNTLMRNSGNPRSYQVVYAASELTGAVGLDLTGITWRMFGGQATFPPIGGGAYTFSDYQIRVAT